MLPKFKIELNVCGVNEGQDVDALSDIRSEINMRPHLKLLHISWDKALRKVRVVLETEGLVLETTANQMAEELFEIACAVLNSIDGLHIEVISSQQA